MNKTLQKEKEQPIGTDNNRSEIARRAYQLWEADGRPTGRDMEYWLQAEAGMINGKPNRSSGKPETAASKQRL